MVDKCCGLIRAWLLSRSRSVPAIGGGPRVELVHLLQEFLDGGHLALLAQHERLVAECVSIVKRIYRFMSNQGADGARWFASNRGRLASAVRAARCLIVMIVTECLPPRAAIVGRSSRA